jgi:fluoroacetyl-CoA thioesterase
MSPVLATACNVALVEATCFDALKPFPKETKKTVGAHVGLSRVAATPMGMRVTAQVELVAVEGRKLRFKRECQHEKERRRAPPDRGRGNRRVGWIFAIVTWW